MLYRIFLVLLTGSILASHTDGSSLSSSTHNTSDGRLPRDLSPYHYEVELMPYIYESEPPFKFTGWVRIFFTVIKSTNVITLNSKEFSIASTMNVTADHGQPGDPADPVISNWSLNAKAEFLEVKLTAPLSANTNYSIVVGFTSTIRNDSRGVYLAPYTAANGSTKYIVATHLEPHRGRQTFPCFDEPEFKATFTTIITYKPPYVSFSNMPRDNIVQRDHGWVSDIYKTTPKMPLYLFAFAVGDFQKLEAESLNGHQVRILARPEILPQMAFAQKYAPLILAWLDNETGIAYREPKLDHIAIPLHWAPTMENWGLVIHSEPYFAVNHETSSTFGKREIAMLIAHETAHQWYGNLVTCKWWNDLWLNEGFTMYYNYRPTQAFGWEGSEVSQLETQIYLESDQKNSSEPVRKDTPTVWDARSTFTESAYFKGGAIIQFLEGILTTKTFKRGLKRYLLKHQYGSVTADDLWQSLTEQASVDKITNPDGSPLNVKLKMDPWVNQMGFPLISVTRRTDGTAVVTRSHFLRPPNQTMNTPSPYNYRWHVPITVVSKSSKPDDWNAGPLAYIDIDKNQTVVSGFPKNLSKWAMINAKAMFFYRVKYDNVSFAAIVSQLRDNNTAIHAQSKSQFIDDAFSVARAGYFSETWGMDSTLYLKKEFEWGPWNSALRHLKYSDRLLRNQTLRSLQRSYILSLAIPIYQRLGWNYSETETPFRHFLRRDMIDVTCTYGHAPCLAEARSQYALIKRDPSANVVNANNLPTVLCVGINEGTEADWQMSFDQYLARKSSPISEERFAYLFGCTCTTDQTLLDRLLTELVTNVAWHDRDALAEYLSKTEYGAQILWNFLDTNWTSIPDTISRMTQLRSIAIGFSTPTELDKLYAFKAHNQPDASEEKLFTSLILDVEANVKWVQTEGPALKQWLLRHQQRSIHVQKRNKRSVNLPSSAMEHWEAVRKSYLSKNQFR